MNVEKETLILNTTEEDIEKAAEIIKAGGLVAFPTETVYGLGADAFNAHAVQSIYEAKGRPSDNPTIVHIADYDSINKIAANVTEDMRRLAVAFWPGPMTMVVKKKPEVPSVTTGGLETVGVRLPETYEARELIRKSGTAIAAPSANISGCPSPTSWEHVYKDMNGKIDAIIKGGRCKHGIESSVIDMTEDIPMVLRPGVITAEMFSIVLGKDVVLDPTLNRMPEGDFVPKAPGMKYKHYAPRAEVTVFAGDPFKARATMDTRAARLRQEGNSVAVIEFQDEETAGRELFGRLRDADEINVDYIFIKAVSEEGMGFAVMNRMLKAAGYNVIEC